MIDYLQNKSPLIRRVFADGYLLILCSVVMFSLMGLFVKLASREHIPTMQTVFFRSAINVLIILGFTYFEKRDLLGKNRKLLVTRSLVGFTSLCCYFLAISKINLADAVILSQTSPIWVSLICIIFMREKFSLSLIVSIAFALFGAVLVLKPTFQFFNAGGFLSLLSGFLVAIVYVSIRKLGAYNSSTTIIFYFTAISSIISFPFAAAQYMNPGPVGWLYLMLVGIFASLGQFAMTMGYKILHPQKASLLSLCNIILAALLSYYILKEPIDIFTVIGGLLILGSSVGVLLLKPLLFGRDPA